MSSLYPLRFAPIFQYRLWGGRKLAGILQTELPGDGPIGEAWALSDRDDFPSVVLDGAHAGKSIKDLILADAPGMFGDESTDLTRYPLLLKFLDAKEMLSVQVHPTDQQTDLLPPGERGKTEAWVVLEAEAGSSIYAGLKPGTTADDLRHLTAESSDAHLASISPKVGETVFLEAGAVHALGGGVVVFEVQQNSDVTFRLFDWDRVDAKTGKTRELHVELALQCIDVSQGPILPVIPVSISTGSVEKEQLVECGHFSLFRITAHSNFSVGAAGKLRSIVCLDGSAEMLWNGQEFPIGKGSVYLLPAAVGEVMVSPIGSMTMLEIALP